MNNCDQFYINGQWQSPISKESRAIINPATEKACGNLAMGNNSDIDRAVAAAKSAFPRWSSSTKEERITLLENIIATYKKYYAEITVAITTEMGAPQKLSETVQAAMGLAHFSATLEALQQFDFQHRLTIENTTDIIKEPIGVVGLITPWNWPMNQVICKVAPALAAGCTIVLKPSQDSALSAYILAKVMDEAGVPAGVFNLVNGSGSQIGDYLCGHADVDMISFTGSTPAGVSVSKKAAETIKRVSLELGGKSANIILDDADFLKAVSSGVTNCMRNCGQTCTAPTRMLIPADKMEEAITIARIAAEKSLEGVGDPAMPTTVLGPVANQAQFNKIQQMIEVGISEGATLISGGLGRPLGLETGFFVKPTIFAHVNNRMVIAQEEIFGPVLCIIPYKDEQDAVNIANDSPFGLSGYISSGSLERAQQVATQMRTGMVHINGAKPDLAAPFGGYKQSGNGREWGRHGLEDFLEIKSVMGWHANCL